MPFDTELVNKSEFKYVIFSFFPEVLKHSIWTVDIRTIQILNYCQLNFILRPKIYIQQNKSNLLFYYNLYVFIMCPVMRIENRLVTIRTILIHIEFGPRRPLIHVYIIQGLDQVKPNYPLIDAACFFLLQVFETEPRALNMVCHYSSIVLQPGFYFGNTCYFCCRSVCGLIVLVLAVLAPSRQPARAACFSVMKSPLSLLSPSLSPHRLSQTSCQLPRSRESFRCSKCETCNFQVILKNTQLQVLGLSFPLYLNNNLLKTKVLRDPCLVPSQHFKK